MNRTYGSVSRRGLLQALSATVGATMLGCAPEGPDAIGEATSLDMSASAMLAQIKKIVVLCMENRSFDHYLGSLRFLEGRSINGLTGTEWNPAPDGTQVPVYDLQSYAIAETPHDWAPAHQQWDRGHNDGFVIANAGPTQNEAMGYYTRDQIPVHYALTDHFTTFDAYFCSVMGPTWPNRFYLHGATSDGVKDNSPIPGFKNIFDMLTNAGVSSINYFGDVPWATGAYFKTTGLAPLPAFFAAAAAGQLPQFSLIDPAFFGPEEDDDHPPSDIRTGQALIASIYAALAQSPDWNRCLFLVIYDEHGGLYDHVPPPLTADDRPEFARLGFRVPAIAIGPYVRKAATVSTVLEHVSVIKTLTRRYSLPVLNQRVAAANDLSAALDATYFGNPQPPPVLPPVPVSVTPTTTKARPPASRRRTAALQAALDAGRIPPSLDRRSSSLGDAEEVLAWATRLGAVKLVR